MADKSDASDVVSQQPEPPQLQPVVEPSQQEVTRERPRPTPFLLTGALVVTALLLGIGALFAGGAFNGDDELSDVPASSTAGPVVAALATDEATEEASPTSIRRTRALEMETERPAPTATTAPSETPTTLTTVARTSPAATVTATTAAIVTPPIDAQSADAPGLLLDYDWQQLVIYNRAATNQSFDVRNLSFVDVESGNRFTSDNWQYREARWRIRPQVDCFQIIDSTFTELPLPDFCMQRQAYEPMINPFWHSAEGKETFNVVWNGEVIGNCPTVPSNSKDRQRCVLGVGSG